MDPNSAEAAPPPGRPASISMSVPLLPASLNVPLLYADGVLDTQYGAFTTKLLLSVEHGPANVPALQLVMPTATLLQAARKLIEDLSSREMIDAVASRQQSFLDMMDSAGSTPSDTTP